jgi:hypothetical protein
MTTTGTELFGSSLKWPPPALNYLDHLIKMTTTGTELF